MIEKNTQLGNINFSHEVVAQTAGGAATECYGVVGMASQKMLKDGFYELLKKDNFSRGIITRDGLTGLIVDMYIFVGYGMKISEINLTMLYPEQLQNYRCYLNIVFLLLKLAAFLFLINREI